MLAAYRSSNDCTMTSALLVIDVQTALCAGEYAAQDIDSVIDRINALSQAARATRVPVLLVQHEEDGGPLAFGTDGWQFAARLQIVADDVRIRKTTPNSFHQTPLHGLLQAHGVSRLVVCGLQTEFCVDTTVRQALALGYAVTLVADGHSTLDNDVLPAAQIVAHHNQTLRHLNSFGPSIELVAACDIRFTAGS